MANAARTVNTGGVTPRRVLQESDQDDGVWSGSASPAEVHSWDSTLNIFIGQVPGVDASPAGSSAAGAAAADGTDLESPAFNGSGSAVGAVGATGDQRLDGLLNGGRWLSGAITYSDTDGANDYQLGYFSDQNRNGLSAQKEGYSQLSNGQLRAVHFALNADTFTQPTGAAAFSVEGFTHLIISYQGAGNNSGTIRVANTSDAATSYAFYPSNAITGGDAWFGPSARTPIAGNYSWHTTLHELGHSLGLKHGQDLGGVAGVALPSNLDSMEYSVMTYRSYIGGPLTGYTNETFGYAQTYMMLDIAALQYMYGADYSINSGNTVYTWSPTGGQTYINGNLAIDPGGNRIFATIWDGGGIDTYDLSNYTTDLSIDLRAGGYSTFSFAQIAYLGNGHFARGNIFNALMWVGNYNSLIENAIGGSGNDTIQGNELNNVLIGGGGNDTLYAGSGNDLLVYSQGLDTLYGDAGTDTADFSSFGSAVWINLNYFNAGWTKDQATLNTGNWRLIANVSTVENIQGTSYDDSLTGDSGNNVIAAGAGNDRLGYTGGLDTLGGDAGIDTADFSGFGFAVWVNLSYFNSGWTKDGVTLNTGNWRPIANLTSIENIEGTSYDDILTGDGGNNVIAAGAGNDLLGYTGGIDTLQGDAGTDAVDFSTFGAAVWINLNYYNAGWTKDGITLDTGNWRLIANLSSVENIVGTGYNDSITGDDGNNVIAAGAGNDLLRYTGGIDTFQGEAGVDTADFSAFGFAVWINLNYFNAAWTMDQPALNAGNWRLIANLGSVENIVGTGYNDSLTGDVWNNVIAAGGGNDLLVYTGGLDTFQGEAGTDTADFSSFGAAVWVNLNYFDAAWTKDRIALDTGIWRPIANLTSIENIVGTGYNDSLTGDSGNNVIAAGAGNDQLAYTGGLDTLQGETGIDTADFSAFGSAVWVNLNYFNAAWTMDQPTLNAGNWRLIANLGSIENVVGSNYNDSLTGDGGNNVIAAGAGDDRLMYTGGFDSLQGDADIDTADFSAFGFAVWVDLNYLNAAWTKDQITLDTGIWRPIANLTSIENVVGGDYNDSLTGDGGNNVISAGGGNDQLAYTGGLDTLQGEAGIDTADFSAFGSAVWVNLNYFNAAWTMDQPTLNAGNWRLIANLTSVESIAGTSYNDSLTGDGGNNVISAGDGNDYIVGGAGSDWLNCGRGSDTLVYQGLSDRGSTGDVIADFAKGAGGDVLDLHDLLTAIGAPHNGNAFTGGFLQFTASGADTLVQVSSTGIAGSLLTLASLTNVLLAQTDVGNYVL